MDSSQTLTRLTYTVNLNGTDVSSLIVTSPPTNLIPLSNLYINIPYKRYQVYIDGSQINSSSPTTLTMINQALRVSWALSNSYLFSPDDVIIPSIVSNLQK